MTITAEHARGLHERVGGIETPMMEGDNLAILLCTHFDDGEENSESDNGWSKKAEDGYHEVIGAIRAHYDPAIRTVISQAEELARVKADLAKAAEALDHYADTLCEGFCQDLPSRGYTDAACERDCGGCKARATLSEITHD